MAIRINRRKKNQTTNNFCFFVFFLRLTTGNGRIVLLQPTEINIGPGPEIPCFRCRCCGFCLSSETGEILDYFFFPFEKIK
jgi:hypothetical protein